MKKIVNKFKIKENISNKIAKEYSENILFNLNKKNRETLLDTKINLENLKIFDLNENLNKKMILLIDLGGSTLKIGFFCYKKNKKCIFNLKKIKIKKSDKKKEKSVFKWIAEKICFYLKNIKKTSEIFNLLTSDFSNLNFKAFFTFSYPLKVFNIKKTELLYSTKSFPFKQFEKGSDPIKLLENECKIKNINIKIFSIINDTTAVFLSGYKSKDFIENSSNIKKPFYFGLVGGTGCNVTYFDNVRNILINAEWGNFCSSHLKLTKFDLCIKNLIESENFKYRSTSVLTGSKYFLFLLNLVLSDAGLEKFSDYKEIKNEIKTKRIKIYKALLKRTQYLVASLLKGILLTQNINKISKIKIITNGSIYHEKYNRSLLKRKLKSLLKCEEIKIKICFKKHSNLLGNLKLINFQ